MLRNLKLSTHFQRANRLRLSLSTIPEISENIYDVKSAYFNKDLQYKNNTIRDSQTNNARSHKQLINLLKYIPVQLDEVQNRATDDNNELYKYDSVTAAKYGGLYLRQITIEDQQHQQAVNDYTEGLQSLLRMNKGTGSKHFQNLLLSWFEPFTKEIIREIDLIRQNVPGLDRKCYGPCLLLLPPETLSVITLNTVINSILKSGNDGVRVSTLANEVGTLIKTEINLIKLKQNKDQIPKWQKDLINVKGDIKKFRSLSKYVLNKYHNEWDDAMKIKTGTALIQFLIEVAKDENNKPILSHKVETTGFGKSTRNQGAIYMDNEYFEEISVKDLYHVNPRFLPMVIPPKRWCNATMTGGYFRLRAPIVRTFSETQKSAVKQAHMPRLLEGLDFLGSVAWRVNSDILRVAKEAWSQGLIIGELPSTQNIPFPTKEECFRPQTRRREMRSNTQESSTGNSSDTVQCDVEADIMVFDEGYYNYRCRRVKKQNSELHSLRCDLQLKLWVAEQFEHEAIFFPHNLDFRGRAYPVPQNLSHLGSDLCRGLLTFAEAKPLGKKGLRWMKIHLCNLFGNNKITFDERVNWFEEHRDEVLDSGLNPLDGNQWWTKAEYPFQALAVCIDLSKAFKLDNPEEYCSRLPVHQDGSCNGLQHYAALGCDWAGAKAVNLIPSEAPQDVYSAVLIVALERLEKDCQISMEDEDLAERSKGKYARMLRGKVDRKVVKQTVMTSVYGVTKIGARKQVQNRLEEKFKSDPSSADLVNTPEFDDDLYKASMYLAALTLDSLTVIFKTAKDIMDWLANTAKLVANEGHSMSWITPLGLPIVQPYRREQSYTVQTLLQKVTLSLSHDILPVSTMKQRSAFPPNYIHSLDASHMLITSLKMKDRRLTFAAVHDSYWTHACDASTLAMVLRESFVELYEGAVMEELRESLQRRYPQISFPPLPERGEFKVHDVLKSKYFFH